MLHGVFHIHRHCHDGELIRHAIHRAEHVHVHVHFCRDNTKGWRRGVGVGYGGDDLCGGDFVCALTVACHAHAGCLVRDHPIALIMGVVAHDMQGRRGCVAVVMALALAVMVFVAGLPVLRLLREGACSREGQDCTACEAGFGYSIHFHCIFHFFNIEVFIFFPDAVLVRLSLCALPHDVSETSNRNFVFVFLGK